MIGMETSAQAVRAPMASLEPTLSTLPEVLLKPNHTAGLHTLLFDPICDLVP